jgi:hypothetical protein
MMHNPTKRILQYIWLFVFLLTLVSFVSAEDSGKTKEDQRNQYFRDIAKRMKRFYDDGQLNEVINLYVKECCKDKEDENNVKPLKETKEFKQVAKEIRADVYQLVTLSYDDLDETGQRDFYFKKLLDIRLHLESDIYRPSWREMAEKKYYVLPRLQLGFNGGINFTIPHPYRNYSILGPAAPTGWDSYHKDYSYNLAHLLGAHLAGVVEYTLTKNLSINMQISAISLAFRYKTNLKWDSKGEGNSEDDPISLNLIHRHELYYIEIPLLLKYRFVDIKTKLKPYLQIGGFLRISQFAHKSIDSTLQIGSETPDENTKVFYLKNLISRINSGFCVGGGISYDTIFMGFNFRLEFGINYKHGFNNVVDKNQRYKFEDLIFAYYDVFDDIKLRSWGLTIKILLPISFKAFPK